MGELPRKHYDFDSDCLLNRWLGEPVGIDAAGWVRERTPRWRWQRFKNRLRTWWWEHTGRVWK